MVPCDVAADIYGGASQSAPYFHEIEDIVDSAQRQMGREWSIVDRENRS